MVSDKAYLNQWAVYEVESDGSIHFVGFNVESRAWEVSPCMLSFNKTLRSGISRNNKEYFLVGPHHQSDSLAISTWRSWSSIRNVPLWADITKEY